jgi:copper resistance protein C
MKRWMILLAALALGATSASLATASSALHFALVRSSPEADASVSSVDEVRLWFSQVPQEGSVSVRLVDPDGEAVETGDLTSDPRDGKVVFVPISTPLPAGGYTVAWRGIGDDGHVVRGDFAFTVAAHP